MTGHDSRALWDRWIELWNGNMENAEEIVHPEFVLHRFPPPPLPDDLRGRRALVAWVGQTRSLFDPLRFEVEVGPMVDGDLMSGRWVADGRYRGGIPRSTATSGTPIRFHGNDILRTEGGMIREYWLSDDLLDLMQQLGAVGSG
jgi:predicted ester cyclase